MITPATLSDSRFNCLRLNAKSICANEKLLAMRFCVLLFCAFFSLSIPLCAQQTLRVIADVPKFTSVDIAKRINLTLVMAADIESLPSDVCAKLLRSKNAVSQMERGGAVCVVKAEPSVAKMVRCEVEDGGLSIYADKFKYKSIPKIDVFVVCDSTLRSIHGSSSSNVFSRGLLRLPSLDVIADYAMSVNLSLMAQNVYVKAKDRSQVTLLGSVTNVRANLVNACSLDLTRLSYVSHSVTADESSILLDGK